MGTNIVFLDWKNQIIRMNILPKVTCSINEIFIKLPMVVFTEVEGKKIIYMGTLKPPNSQSRLEKEKSEPEEIGSLASDYTKKLQ